MFLKKKFNFFASYELQVEFLITISGKSKIIPELMWLRNNEEPKIDISSEPKIDVWWYNRKFEKEKQIFFNHTKKIINEFNINQKLNIDELAIEELFLIYVKKIVENTKKTFLRQILNLVPYEIKKLIKFAKKWYYTKTHKYRPILNEKSLSEEINILEKEKIFINQEELNKIKSILLNKNSND